MFVLQQIATWRENERLPWIMQLHGFKGSPHLCNDRPQGMMHSALWFHFSSVSIFRFAKKMMFGFLHILCLTFILRYFVMVFTCIHHCHINSLCCVSLYCSMTEAGSPEVLLTACVVISLLWLLREWFGISQLHASLGWLIAQELHIISLSNICSLNTASHLFRQCSLDFLYQIWLVLKLLIYICFLQFKDMALGNTELLNLIVSCIDSSQVCTLNFWALFCELNFFISVTRFNLWSVARAFGHVQEGFLHLSSQSVFILLDFFVQLLECVIFQMLVLSGRR
jgi:hypothetical protein